MCENKPELGVPMITVVFQCNAEEFREWRDGILKNLDEIEDLLRASRAIEIGGCHG